jgi:hypothetical protein
MKKKTCWNQQQVCSSYACTVRNKPMKGGNEQKRGGETAKRDSRIHLFPSIFSLAHWFECVRIP